MLYPSLQAFKGTMILVSTTIKREMVYARHGRKGEKLALRSEEKKSGNESDVVFGGTGLKEESPRKRRLIGRREKGHKTYHYLGSSIRGLKKEYLQWKGKRLTVGSSKRFLPEQRLRRKRA